MTNCIIKPIPKTARDFAIKHKINLRQDHFGMFMILENCKIVEMSFAPTAKSAICMMKKYLKNKGN